MEPARADKTKYLTLDQAAQLLSVDTETLLRWNEDNLLKAIVTPYGEVGYTVEQIENFLKIKFSDENTFPSSKTGKTNDSPNDIKRIQERDESIFDLLKPKFLEDKKTKNYLRSQIDESLNYNFNPPSKKFMRIVVILVVLLLLPILSQRGRIQNAISNYSDPLKRSVGQVLQASTSNLVLSGRVIVQTPLIGKQDVSFEKDFFVEGESFFTGNITAPNVVYELREGDNILISEAESQRPIISVDFSSVVTTVQGQSGNIVLDPGTDISIDGLTINNISTLSSVASRGSCSNCITDDAVVNSLTIDSSGNISGDAIKSGDVDPTVGGTGITTYETGDMIYASDDDELEALNIGTIGQFLTVGIGGIPSWDNVGSFAVAVVKEDDVVVSSPTNVLDFLGGDFDLTATPSGEVNIQLAPTLTSVIGVAGDFNIPGDLTSQGDTNLSSGAGSSTQIGTSSGTFSLSSTGLNVTTGGALTGVVSIDTISFSDSDIT
ncbi:hypothetical protein JXA63_00305, partial [Candidatus Woesebacteria bacterium]|nr:hypothetical protein [Candidatus Woesebacteria bacterium]